MITDTFTQTATSNGILIEGGFGHVVKGCHFYNNGVRGVSVSDGGRCSFTDCTIDHNGQQGILFITTEDGWSRGHIVKGCRLFSNSGDSAGTYAAIALDSAAVATPSTTTGVTDSIFAENVIYDEESTPDGTVAFSIGGTDNKNNTFSNNYISADVTTQYPSSSTFLTQNNVIAQVSTKLNVLQTTNSTTKATGSLVLSGGLGVGGGCYVNNITLDDSSSDNGKKAQLLIKNSVTPASSGASGVVGSICWDTGYIYVCYGANAWKRAAITVW